MTTTSAFPRVPFNSAQRKILLALATAVGMRMLGLFLVLPVFTLYGLRFTESRFLAGLAFGCYGLTMALFQIPLGRLSDRIGRKKVMLLGMAIFSLGSFLCALPPWLPQPWQIGGLILGRLVQGSGAIVSTAFAAVADHVDPEHRSLAMAVLGIPIGAAFVLGVVGGPVLAAIFNTESLFWLTGILGILTVFLLARYLPEGAPSAVQPARVGEILRSRPLLALDLGGFLMNFSMSAFFFFLPLIVTGRHHLEVGRFYTVLLPMLVASGITTFLFSWAADRGWARLLGATAFLILMASSVALFQPAVIGLDPGHLTSVLVAGTLFFIGFTGLEPILPSMISRTAPATAYGTALGIYNTLQFLGSFAGGSVAGALARSPSTHIMATLMAASALGFLLMLARPNQ